MTGAIGESLVVAHLLAHGWPTANANFTIKNSKTFDLYCQASIDSNEIIGIQVKTTTQKSFPIGLSCEQAADRAELSKKIRGPWVFVHIKSPLPLSIESITAPDVDFYIVPRADLIDLIYEGHQWYLYKWTRQATPSLRTSMAAVALKWIKGDKDKSRFAPIDFINPFPGNVFLNKWANIWKKS